MERDDIYEYSLDHIHGEEEGKKIVKRFNFVIFLLSAVTAVEVTLGLVVAKGTEWWPVTKWAFLILTLVKAGYIVMEFMHLGDEKKQLRWIILGPYLTFIAYLVFICINEASSMFSTLQMYSHF